jgi:Ca-activated chloride channel family protein
MKTLSSIILILSAFTAASQITAEQQKSLNAYVDYANASAEEVERVVKSVISYYPTFERKNASSYARYTCPYQLDGYFLKNANDRSKNLKSEIVSPLTKAMSELQTAEGKIDQSCKALDTYHKLEDYKTDQFANAKKIIADIKSSLDDYRLKQDKLQSALETAYQKLSPTASHASYHSTRQKMLQAIRKEKEILDGWVFNLNSKVHTGWPVRSLEQSIPETQKLIVSFENNKPTLNYPASSTWGQFAEGLADVVRVKQNGVDGYNFEAKKSDEHSNGLYMDYINYFNGTLISFYNNFIQFSERDGFYGLKAIKYVPGFDIRTSEKTTVVELKAFQNIPHIPLTVKPQPSQITKNAFAALTAYIDFINETWRQTSNLQSVLSNFNSNVNSFKRLESFEKRAPMSFDFSDYKVPLSAYQDAVSKSAALPPAIAKHLNEQSGVILNILKELDESCAFIEAHVKARTYEQDHLTKLLEILQRQAELFAIWDDRKELLYQDVRTVFDSYPRPATKSSWLVSGTELQTLVDLNHDALFRGKKYYKGDSSVIIPTDGIDKKLREVIEKEFSNMKGIEKYGRNNGLCPYSPYEDIPKTSRQLSEHFQQLKPVTNSSRYNHPYYNMVYLYNSIVDDYNKFSELSTTVPHLKTVKQPELFILKGEETVKKPITNKPTEPVSNTPTSGSTEKPVPSNQNPHTPSSTEKIFRDTVYIEKRDTVYIREPNEDLRSMEGYATNNMILLLDISGSMNQPEKLPLLKSSILDLLTMMRAEDKISIIAFSGKPKVLLKSTSFKEEEKIRKAINALSSSGKTDGNTAVELAYKVADENYIRGGNNRIILATDGEFTLNDAARSLIEKFAGDDIFLSVFNFGKGMGSSKSLEAIAVLGKGNYESISKENVNLKLITEAKAKRRK